MRNLLISMLSLSTLAFSGCSTVMEAKRPQAVNLRKFVVGERRFDVVAELGEPTGSERDGGNSCDVYKLYTHGVGKAGKAAIIVGEGAADVFTIGLFEIVATPAEAVTRNNIHTVMFCYSADKSLVLVRESGRNSAAAIDAPEPLHGESTPQTPTSAGQPSQEGAPPSPAHPGRSSPSPPSGAIAPPSDPKCGSVPQRDGSVKLVPC